MAERWLIADAEDDGMQGISADAQVIYMRTIRRYMNYATGVSAVTYDQMKTVLEYLPDSGSQQAARRKRDVSNHQVRARLAELERAGLIEVLPKKSRFEAPSFRCVLAVIGSLRPEEEPQRNRKEGTAKGAARDKRAVAGANGKRGDKGTAKEPQEGNRNISGSPVNTSVPKGTSVTRVPRLDLSVLPDRLSTAVWRDWQRHRRSKRAPVTTQTVVDQMAKELKRAEALGIHPDQALAETMAAGWQGVKADWLAKRLGIEQGVKHGAGNEERDYRAGATPDDQLPAFLRDGIG